ncbi:MAG: WhiB family transcriptional regulator [Egibacteraceae bacterium]
MSAQEAFAPDEWRLLAACRGMDVELFYSTQESDNRTALRVCGGCPVRAQCFAAAMDHRESFGVWGGTLETQRRRVFRRERRERRRSRDADAA